MYNLTINQTHSVSAGAQGEISYGNGQTKVVNFPGYSQEIVDAYTLAATAQEMSKAATTLFLLQYGSENYLDMCDIEFSY